jgi:hypothetical protein
MCPFYCPTIDKGLFDQKEILSMFIDGIMVNCGEKDER